MTIKTIKFQPGTFLEMDDLVGQRKVVLVCKDGVTYWDVLDAKVSTPVIIHPQMNPVEIGTFVQYGINLGLQQATRAMIAYLRNRQDVRLYTDPLFVMRVLWFVAKKAAGDGYVPGEAVLDWACEQAAIQEANAARVHRYAEQFCAA